ncbi:MAG: dephospho-CoA kinase [Neisseria sp.]|uniref:dephospho-CoA kinase n=1 Tax=Neisseria sp. TaxID=192066 RepID=UPI0026DADC0B|nr:dephospho-CoA kinase [Neisseria sp.]MDO4248310.1 dephospho-CoA kinase [Neisseria sp.]
MTVWVGLTGGIGSGKSKAAAEFLRLGVPLIDADAVSRSLTAENGAALSGIRRQFGDDLFDDHACLKRAALRDLVFASDKARNDLEALMHPLILAEIKNRKAAYPNAGYGVIEIPLLVEKPAFKAAVDRVLVVESEEAIRLQRVVRRSNLTEEAVLRIMAAQAADWQRRMAADDILVNNGTEEELAAKVGRFHLYYSRLK